jgi:co-chaperonin GroES (HSP10)
MSQLIALRDEVIVRPRFQEKVGCLHLPTGKGQFKQYHGFVYGEVVAIGHKYPNKELQVGNKVIFTRHEGRRMTVGGQEYLKLRERFVEAIID